MNQLDLQENTSGVPCAAKKSRENETPVVYLLRKWREIFQPITNRSNVNQRNLRVRKFDVRTRVKIPL